MFLVKNATSTKNAGPVALAAMEEYSGAYMRLLHNVFRVDRASLVLENDTPTTPVQADRDVTRTISSGPGIHAVPNPALP